MNMPGPSEEEAESQFVMNEALKLPSKPCLYHKKGSLGSEKKNRQVSVPRTGQGYLGHTLAGRESRLSSRWVARAARPGTRLRTHPTEGEKHSLLSLPVLSE